MGSRYVIGTWGQFQWGKILISPPHPNKHYKEKLSGERGRDILYKGGGGGGGVRDQLFFQAAVNSE